MEHLIGRIEMFEGRDLQISPLSGGHMNGVFLVGVGDERFAVRVPGQASEILEMDRAAERYNAGAAAETGVSPRILDYLDDANVMVLEFVEGAIPTIEDVQSLEQVQRMVTSIRRLHDGRRYINDFDMLARARHWLQACQQRGFPVPDGALARLGQVEEIARVLRSGTEPTVPCHNDLAPYNFIDDGQQLWIIDFEFSGNNDPCYDLGGIASEAELDDALTSALCASYFGETTPRLLARMKLHAAIANFGWMLFCSIQAELIPDPGFWEGATAYWTTVLEVLDSKELPQLMQDAAD